MGDNQKKSSRQMSTSLERDKELTGAFNEGGKDIEKRRDRSNNAKEKIIFFKQLIRIVLTDTLGNIVPRCDFLITRSKCTRQIIEGMFMKSPRPDTDIDYFIDNTGTPIWMDDFMLNSQPKPTYYIVIPKVKRDNYDILEHTNYEGQTVFQLSRVPLKCKDENTIVNETILREWILFAIAEVDPHSRPFYRKIEETNVALKAIDKKIKGVAKLQFYEPNGEAMTPEKAQEEREAVYEVFANERSQADARLRQIQQGLEKHLKWRANIGMKFEQVEIDENTSTAVWHVRFYGTTDAQEMEDLLIKKRDWSGIKLCAGQSNPPLPILVTRGRIPDGTKNEIEPNYTLLNINMAGCRIARVAHGTGTYKVVEKKDLPFSGDHFELFYGDYELGRKVGRGIEVNDTGIFNGRYINGDRSGPGRFDLADGTCINGTFNVLQRFDIPENDSFHNPYREGDPQGIVNILFADGAWYRGQVKNGRIHGQGEYESAFGELLIGNFNNGVLHGKNGNFKNHSGETYMGEWYCGELHGEGEYKNLKGDSYVGYWNYNMRHGRGVSKYSDKGEFQGYYANDVRTGKGILEFGKRRMDKEKTEKKGLDPQKVHEAAQKMAEGEVDPEKEPESLFKHNYQGYFVSDSLVSGGIIKNNENNIALSIHPRNRRRLLGVFKMLKYENKTKKAIRRRTEKYNDMELHIRKEICKKKMKIYAQQKHFTKREMYAEELSAIGEKDYKSRQVIRESRLARVPLQNEEIVTKHLVPRIKISMINSEPVNYLSNALKKIKPDKENGKVKKPKNILMRLAASDFEEVKERQRFLKYDLIWQRAEEAFSNKKKG